MNTSNRPRFGETRLGDFCAICIQRGNWLCDFLAKSSNGEKCTCCAQSSNPNIVCCANRQFTLEMYFRSQGQVPPPKPNGLFEFWNTSNPPQAPRAHVYGQNIPQPRSFEALSRNNSPMVHSDDQQNYAESSYKDDLELSAHSYEYNQPHGFSVGGGEACGHRLGYGSAYGTQFSYTSKPQQLFQPPVLQGHRFATSANARKRHARKDRANALKQEHEKLKRETDRLQRESQRQADESQRKLKKADRKTSQAQQQLARSRDSQKREQEDVWMRQKRDSDHEQSAPPATQAANPQSAPYYGFSPQPLLGYGQPAPQFPAYGQPMPQWPSYAPMPYMPPQSSYQRPELFGPYPLSPGSLGQQPQSNLEAYRATGALQTPDIEERRRKMMSDRQMQQEQQEQDLTARHNKIKADRGIEPQVDAVQPPRDSNLGAPSAQMTDSGTQQQAAQNMQSALDARRATIMAARRQGGDRFE